MNAADAALREIYEAEWQWRTSHVGEADGVQKPDDAPVADRLPSIDEAAQSARRSKWRDIEARLAAIDRDALSLEERINFDVYRNQIDTMLARQAFRDFEMPANSDSSFWNDLTLAANRVFRDVDDYGNWIAQLNDVPRYFREQIAHMQAGLARGFTPPFVTMAGRDRTIAAVVEAAPEASAFYAPFRQMIAVPIAEQGRLRELATQAIREVVQPAYADLLRFMRNEYLPRLRASIAAADLPDGTAYYRAKIREFTTLDHTPQEIHDLGRAEVAALHLAMGEVMRELGFHGDLRAFVASLRAQRGLHAKSAEELLMRAAWIAKKFDGKAALYFGKLPRARFAIQPVPDDLAPFYTAGRGAPGVYLLNTYDLASRPLYNLPALTLHESAPGHAFQMSLALEQSHHPEFRRRTFLSAYGEGWALYCERLGLEMGIYETPYERFGMLGYQAWRAARLVADTGLHAMGWSREQALAYLGDSTALSEQEVRTEVDRYITWPGQALSYYVGQMSIVRSRGRAEAALGGRFDLRAFHDLILELGSVPLVTLEEHVGRYISARVSSC